METAGKLLRQQPADRTFARAGETGDQRNRAHALKLENGREVCTINPNASQAFVIDEVKQPRQ